MCLELERGPQGKREVEVGGWGRPLTLPRAESSTFGGGIKERDGKGAKEGWRARAVHSRYILIYSCVRRPELAHWFEHLAHTSPSQGAVAVQGPVQTQLRGFSLPSGLCPSA